MLAWHSYENSSGSFPLNYMPAGTDGTPTYSTYSWMQAILPQIEMLGLYSTLGIGQPLGLATDPVGSANYRNYQAARTVVPAYRCPSDAISSADVFADGRGDMRLDPGPVLQSNDPLNNRAVTSYMACCGSNQMLGCPWAHNSSTGRWSNLPVTGNGFGRDDPFIHCNGVMCSNVEGLGPSDSTVVRRNTTKIVDIKDGLSNTFAIGEVIPAYYAYNWWFCSTGVTASCGIPLNNPLASPQNYMNDGQDMGFWSAHPGGTGFAMCDGSVTFVGQNIDLTIYRNLGTIDAGEIAEAP